MLITAWEKYFPYAHTKYYIGSRNVRKIQEDSTVICAESHGITVLLYRLWYDKVC